MQEKRLVPEAPGWWEYKRWGIGPVIGYIDFYGELSLHDSFNTITPVTDPAFEWLRPIPTAEEVERLKEEIVWLKQLRDW